MIETLLLVAMLAQLPPPVVDQHCPTEPADQYNLTPICLDDKLKWNPVPDDDLESYRVYKIIAGQEIEIALVPAGTVTLFIGCVEEMNEYCVRSIDQGGNLSVNCSNVVTWPPGLDWDCVEETRTECDPTNPCTRVCDRWDTCVLDGTAFRCCRMAHFEPPGCVECGPPIGGRAIWQP